MTPQSARSKGIEAAYRAWKDALATGERVEEASQEFFAILRRLAGSIVHNTLRRRDQFLESDIVTQAFLKAKGFQEMSSFGTWFYRLAYNQCLKDLRAKRHRKEVFLDDLLQEPVQAEKTSGEFIERFASLRGNLTREDREFIELRLQGYTVREIGEKRGWGVDKSDNEWRGVKRRVKKLLESQPEARTP